MNCCRKYKDVVSIDLYAGGIYFNQPFFVENTVLTNSEYSFNQGARSKRLHIHDMEATITDETNQSTAGRIHVVNVEYTINSNADKVLEMEEELKMLRQRNYDMLVTFLGGNQAIIRSTPESWMVNTKESDGNIRVTINLHNISGVQRIKQ